MTKTLYKSGDVVSGAVLTGLGVYVILEARGWEYSGPDGPGPGFFPMWYGVAIVALSLILVIGAFSRRAHEAGGKTNWREIGRALVVWSALALSIALLKVLGFLVSFALLTLFVVSFMYGRPILHGVAAGVASSLVFYLIFPFALNVALPVGVLGL
jgi:putative tricarboxylic transport membrane protein